MPAVTIEPATSQRFPDAEHALTGGGDGASCQCQWWIMPNKEFEGTTRSDRERMLRTQLRADVPPALIAYVEGEAAGWVRVGPRTAQPRLARTRAFGGSRHAWDDPDVWAITCFVVRREHRRQGINARLLAAAVDLARRSGAHAIEAYPVDTAVARRAASGLYTGILSVFEAEGFRVVARAEPDRAIVELRLT